MTLNFRENKIDTKVAQFSLDKCWRVWYTEISARCTRLRAAQALKWKKECCHSLVGEFPPTVRDELPQSAERNGEQNEESGHCPNEDRQEDRRYENQSADDECHFNGHVAYLSFYYYYTLFRRIVKCFFHFSAEIFASFLFPKAPCFWIVYYPTSEVAVKFIFKSHFLVDVILHFLHPLFTLLL